MDAYEATRVVFSRIQTLDPENAAKIMGLLLLQDHGEKEMIRLAFGPEALLHSVVAKARKDLGLLPPSTPSTPSATAASSPFLFSRQNSSRLMPPPPLSVASPSWAPPPVFTGSNNSGGSVNGVPEDTQNPDELISTGNPPPSSPFHGTGDLIDELQLQNQLSFLNDPAAAQSALPVGHKVSDLFYPEECRSPNGNGDGMLFLHGVGWGVNGHHRRSCSAAADLCLGLDSAGAGLGWRPCLYFARGYCKNGSSCRFLHGLPDDTAAAMAACSGMDALVEQQCQELLLRSKSPRLGSASQLMASATAFPYSPTGPIPLSPSSRCVSFLQNDGQRAAAAAAAALMLGGDDSHKFMGRSRMERNDFAGMVNPGSRQIYLTFPADSTFREEDVSNYFSIYGPVQDVRIPYQQKRMFGFVTFVYPETVKLILAKGNPHFVCDARVLVKPYKEKGKVPDKYRKQQQQAERGDFSGCSTPTALDSRDPFEMQQLGARMLYSSSQEALLRRKLEEQQQAAELQQAIELQGRRFMGLQLLDLKNRSLSSPTASVHINPGVIVPPPTASTTISDGRSSVAQEEPPPGDKSAGAASGATNGLSQAAVVAAAADQQRNSKAVNPGADKEESGGETSPSEDSDFQESAEHNLPDSPFASPTKATFVADSLSVDNPVASPISSGGSRLIPSTLLPPTSSFNSCFFQMPRFSSDHGAIGM